MQGTTINSSRRTMRRPNALVSLLAFAAVGAALGCGSDDARDPAAVPPFPGAGEMPAPTPPTDGQVTPPTDGSQPPAAETPNPTPGNEGGPGGDVELEQPAGTDTTGSVDPTTETPVEEPPAPPGVLGYPENTGAFCDVTAGAYGGDNPNLPNPFAKNDGSIITSRADWTCRRNEIKKDLEEFEIGVKPEPPQVNATLNGNTLNVQITTPAGSMTLTSNVSGTGSCVVIGMDGPSNLVNGCRQIPFSAGQVVQVSTFNSDQPPDDPYYTVYPELYEEAPYGGTPTANGNRRIGNYSAWSWGISRLIDGIEQVAEQLGVNTSKIAVHGCSYAGKMALFAGALDERVALTVAQESGGGGIPSWRLSEDYNTRTGVDVEKIDNTNWSWFKDSMLNPPLNPHQLPHDHHELVAMIAPRAFITLGNPTQSWLSDESGYKSLVAAREVWNALGAGDKFGFDFNTTQAHCAASPSQVQSVNAFVNRFLLDQEVSTNIQNPPTSGGFDLNTDAVIDWETPTLQ